MLSTHHRFRSQVLALLLTLPAGALFAQSVAPRVAAQPRHAAPQHAPSPQSAQPRADLQQAVAPYAGHVNHAHTSPTFRWGWFGAEHFYPRVHWHRDYNGEVIRWSHQRRY